MRTSLPRELLRATDPRSAGQLRPHPATRGLVSVIIPCYNRAHLVLETLQSVGAQTYSPVEVIVVDDASTDDSVEAIQRWIRTNPTAGRIGFRCLRQPQNAGPSAARNRGLRESRGEFIQFLDSDDLLEPEKLARQVAVLERDATLDFCVCNYVRVNAGNTEVLREFDLASYPHTIENFPALYPMNSVTPLYRRRIVDQAGGYVETLQAAEDFEFNFRVMLEGKGTWLGEPLVRCRTHESPERIQAGGYARNYSSLAEGLMKMEQAAGNAGVLTRRLLAAFARKALDYEWTMAREQEPAKVEFFRRHARARLGFREWHSLRLRHHVREFRKGLARRLG